MSHCIFTKRGLKTVRFNDEKEKEEIFLEEHPARHINHYCEIEEGTTLKQIMNVVAKDEVLSAIIGIYSDVTDIQGWHDQLNKKSTRKVDLERIEIYRSGQIYKKDIQLWTEWHGVLKKKEHGSKLADLSYTDLCDIAHVPVVLNHKFKIWGDWQNKKDTPHIDFRTWFTMLEVLHPIYYDVGFHGSPKDREAIKEEIDGKLNGLLKELDDLCES